MRAVLAKSFGGPEVLEIAERSMPQPGPGEVLVRVRAAGVNPVDCYIRSGTYARKPELPYIPGSDAAGTVEALGDGVPDLAPGERVYAWGQNSGACAEYLVAPRRNLQRLPQGISFSQGAALGIPYATALYALLYRGQALNGETLLVRGASGGVGLAALQIARGLGLRSFGTAGSSQGLEAVQAEGALAAFDHRRSDCADAFIQANGGRGADLILEMLANRNLAEDLRLLAPAGRVLVVGSRGRVEIDPREAMQRNADLRGVILAGAKPEQIEEIHTRLLHGLSAGQLQPRVGLELPLREAAAAHEAVMRDGKVGKVILLP